MSGTDHAKAAEWGGPQPAIVLVEPQMGENIGAAARAMWNFGLERMRIVNPRDGWPNQKAVTMSSGAARVIDAVQVTQTTEEAVQDLNYVFATTARGRDLTKPVVTPERAMEQARAMVAEGQNVGILFGPERSGLENPDIARANAIISVPVNPAFASLNLAQCVLLLAYEWHRQQGDAAPEVLELAGTKHAEAIEIQKLSETLEARLESVGFFWPDHKAESMVTNLRNMISRMPLTQADVRMFHGVIKSLADKHPKSR
ncbi:RNA methyltransferase [Neptunicoccus cionae]|uniref:RNA methyltransferase n=1 Tax=Neptunicoccus cionae TaxID=2035344 RepID=UPI000C76C724|nr:RNA methyltransferase [Amylibacter cionae]PLS20528.1 RNA methyltransferase [Amylibacter cionae]